MALYYRLDYKKNSQYRDKEELKEADYFIDQGKPCFGQSAVTKASSVFSPAAALDRRPDCDAAPAAFATSCPSGTRMTSMSSLFTEYVTHSEPLCTCSSRKSPFWVVKRPKITVLGC